MNCGVNTVERLKISKTKSFHRLYAYFDRRYVLKISKTKRGCKRSSRKYNTLKISKTKSCIYSRVGAKYS